jgi:hypothetical protein
MSGRGDYSRQSFLGAESEYILANTRVAIVGVGGGGSHIAQQLAHLGVGHFRLIDPDQIEASNLNRLVSASQDDVDQKRYKVRILEHAIRAVRPWASVTVVEKEWQKSDSLLRDAHVIFGCIDGYRQRFYLERAARRYVLPYVDIGMDVVATKPGYAVSGQLIVSLPGEPCMTCMGFLTPERLAREEEGYGEAGDNPQVVWANGVLASLAVGAFVQMMSPWCSVRAGSQWLEFDGNAQTVTPSLQMKFNVKGPCTHFSGADDIGDPFFRVAKPAP